MNTYFIRIVMKTIFPLLTFGILSLTADEITVSSLRDSLSSPITETRRAAALKLGELKNLADPAFQELAKACKDTDPVVATRAIQALGQNRSNREEVVKIWQEGLESPHDSVRIASAESLGRLRPTDIQGFLDPLVAALDDGNRLVVVATADSIARLDFRKFPEGKERVAKASKTLLESADPMLQGVGAGMLAWQQTDVEAALPVLTNLLTSPSRDIRRNAFTSIQRYGTLAITMAPVLLACLESAHEHDRSNAGRALLSVDPENAVASMAEVLKKSNVQLAREGAVRALQSSNTDAARDAIAYALRDRAANVRFFACNAILRSGRAGEAAAENLREILRNDRSSMVKEVAREALEVLK